jgi:hypothetical protein
MDSWTYYSLNQAPRGTNRTDTDPWIYQRLDQMRKSEHPNKHVKHPFKHGLLHIADVGLGV